MSLSARKPTRRRALRRTYLVGAMLLTVLVVVVQMRFQHTEQRTAEVVAQLRFLRDELRAGAGERMQELFPEGYFFSHVLYGLTWTDVARQSPVSKDEALREARWALRRLDSADGRAPFDPTLRPAYGVFHAGWTNRLRGAVVGLAGPGAPETARLRGECQALADAFADALDRSEPFLPAYPGQAWPVDSVVAIAALRTHDRVTTPRFGALIDRWVAVAREQVDPGTGLLWHQVTPSRDPAR
ncbi:MAG TPA: hypothetical protein VI076_05970, partial [Actinopolymorphaceae bacterium]